MVLPRTTLDKVGSEKLAALPSALVRAGQRQGTRRNQSGTHVCPQRKDFLSHALIQDAKNKGWSNRFSRTSNFARATTEWNLGNGGRGATQSDLSTKCFGLFPV